MEQRTPTVTRTDVDRVVRREFPSDQFDSVMSVLAEYGRETWHEELHRVHLAVLKLATGRLDALRREIDKAKADYRDVLAYAEYPAYMKTMFCVSPLPATEQQKIIDGDWKQYQSWLNK